MQEKIERLTARINRELQQAESHFTEWNESHKLRMARIDGLIYALELITDEHYFISGTPIIKK